MSEAVCLMVPKIRDIIFENIYILHRCEREVRREMQLRVGL